MDIFKLTEKELLELKANIDYIIWFAKEGAGRSLDNDLIVSLLQETLIIPCLPLVTSEMKQEVYRMTVNKEVVGDNKRIWDIKYLKAPPKDVVKKFGRCNLPGQSVFYGTYDHLTLFNEKRPITGAMVTTSIWRPRVGARLIFCPIFKNQPVSGFTNPRTLTLTQDYIRYLNQYPPGPRKLIDEIFQFFTNEFSKRVTTEDRDYLFSAIYSDKVLNVIENGAFEAIHYPSVEQGLSFENIAIKATVFDSKYELVKVSDGIVNGRFIVGLGNCKEFDFATGKILWSGNTM